MTEFWIGVVVGIIAGGSVTAWAAVSAFREHMRGQR